MHNLAIIGNKKKMAVESSIFFEMAFNKIDISPSVLIIFDLRQNITELWNICYRIIDIDKKYILARIFNENKL